MNLSSKMKSKNPNYIGSYRKGEVERISEVFDMVRNMKHAIESQGYAKVKSTVVPKFRGSVVDLYIEDEA